MTNFYNFNKLKTVNLFQDKTYFNLQEEKIEHNDFVRLSQIMSAIRNAMYAAKGFKDVYDDRMDFRNTIDNEKYSQYKLLQTQLNEFYDSIFDILKQPDKQQCFEKLKKMLHNTHNEYDQRVNLIYKQGVENGMREIDISTLLNIYREMYSSRKSLIYCLKDYLLDTEHAETFDNGSPAA